MSLDKWLKPIQVSEITHLHPKDRIDTSLNAGGTSIGILGVYEADANRVREEFYQFELDFPEEMFVDLGNLIRPHAEDLKKTLQLLLERDVLPVIIGRNAPDALLDGRAGFTFRRPVHVHSNMPEYLLKPVDGHPHFGAYGLIGLQRHFTKREDVRNLREEEIEIYKLGDVRKDIHQVEPLLRESDSCFISLNSLRYSDCPGKRDFNPSGLFAEEVCQVARYAGYSEEVQCLHLYDYLSERDRDGQSAQLIAQIMWYFAEGVSMRHRDRHAGSSAFQSFIVGDSSLDYTLTFIHSSLSGRWWVVEGTVDDFDDRSKWKACSATDYKAAARGEISDRLFRTIRTT